MDFLLIIPYHCTNILSNNKSEIKHLHVLQVNIAVLFWDPTGIV